MPKDFSCADDPFPIREFAKHPFLRLASSEEDEVGRLLEKSGVTVADSVAVWDDFALMSMVEQGLGLSILPSLVLNRCAYDVRIADLDTGDARKIVLVCRSESGLSSAAATLLEEALGVSRDPINNHLASDDNPVDTDRDAQKGPNR